MAARGDQEAGSKARALLRSAEKQAGGAADDYELHAQLGFLEQVSGETQDAAREYRQALSADPFDSIAAGNLALIEASQSHNAEAIRLWSEVFAHDPEQLGAGLNLAIMQCNAGRRNETLQTLRRLQTFAPDSDKARSKLSAIRDGKQSCGSE
jgi:Flp pilus assembly protein TadD